MNIDPFEALRELFPRATTLSQQVEVCAGLLVAAALAIAAGLVVRYTGHPIQRLGRIVYLDNGLHSTLHNPEVDVNGRPDFVVWAGPPFRKEHRPVELKTSKPPRTPYPGHVLQLAGQGFLIEAETGHYPRAGYIVYKHEGRYTFHKVRLGHRARALTHGVVQAIQQGHYPANLPVDVRCSRCRQATVCPIRARYSTGSATP